MPFLRNAKTGERIEISNEDLAKYQSQQQPQIKQLGEDDLIRAMVDPGLSSNEKELVQKIYDIQQKKKPSVKKIQNIKDILNIAQELPTGGERTAVNDAVVFADEVQSALKALDEAEKGGLPGASGPLTNILQGLAGRFGIDTPEAALKDQLTNLVQLVRKERTGVQFSEQEQKELENLVGSLKIQEGPLRRKLNSYLSKAVNSISTKANIDRSQVDSVYGVEGSTIGNFKIEKIE